MQHKQKIKLDYLKDQTFHEIMLSTQTCQPAPTQQPMLNFDNAILGKRGVKNRKGKNLKQILLKHKVNKLTQNFARKIRMNSIYRPPLEDLQDQQIKSLDSNDTFTQIRLTLQKVGQFEGVQLNTYGLVAWSIINTIQTICMVFMFSIMVAFPQTQNFDYFSRLQVVSCALYVVDILLNLISQRYESGKKLKNLSQIIFNYWKNGFIIDFISVIMFPISLVTANRGLNSVITVIYLIKMLNSLRKLEKFQYLVITNNQKEQYYGLIRVFLTNFAIGHFLSVFLNLMTSVDADENWHLKLGIVNSSWYIKYIWGYYWGTNIMLTVGFGDITAANYYQAIMLVFIETFSCITLAYNISYVGALISSIRQNQQSKKRKLKTFHRMCNQNQVSYQIQSKISNFIEESYQIKQAFQHDARDQVIQFLPKQMQRQYRKQANKILFDGLGFLNNLSKKSLLRLAQEVNRRICHPQQIIFKKGSITDFCILQKGCVAFTCKTRSQLDGKVIENLNVQGQLKPKIISLDFIKNKTVSYNIKSVNYSVLYYLSRQNFMQAISNSQMDYQLFCVLKDKDECMVDQNNLYPCLYCHKQFHNKFECTRLHYIPLKQNVVTRYLSKFNVKNQPRKKFSRSKIQILDPLLNLKLLSDQQQRYLQDNFDFEYYNQIKQLFQFYQPKFKEQDKQMVQDVQIQQVQMGHKRRNLMSNINVKTLIDEKAIHKLQQLIQQNKKQNKFWQFQLDIAENFGYYFKQNNPDNLHKIRRQKKLRNALIAEKTYFPKLH